MIYIKNYIIFTIKLITHLIMKAPYVFNLSLLLLFLISNKVSGRIIIRTPERLGSLFVSKLNYK